MKTFAAKLQKYIGKPFKAGGMDDSGYDCIHLLYAVSRDLGRGLPDAFEGWTLADCHELYQRSAIAAQAVLIRFFKSLPNPVKPTRLLAGDVLLFHQPAAKRTGSAARIFPAIYVGNNRAVTAFITKGVAVFELDEAHRPILARRLSLCLQ